MLKALLLFTFQETLQHWNELGIIDREIALYNKLKNKEIDFQFITYGNENDLSFKSKLNKIDIIPVKKYINSNNSILRLIRSFFLPIYMKKLFKNVDFIKTNQINGCWVAFIPKILYKKALIIRGGYEWFRNFLNMPRSSGLINDFRFLINYFFYYIIEYIAYRLADKIILSNKDDIKFIIKTFRLNKRRDKIVLIPNYIDTDLFKPINNEKKTNHILFIGRLYIEKNLFNLFEAMKNLKDFTLDLIGNGPYREYLEEKAKLMKININFLGTIPNSRLPSIINQYEMFILPSYFEGNPKSLLEAMSCGIPCIGTNVRGINEIITHGENGYLCGISSNSIKKAIIALSNDKQLKNYLGKNAREYILKNCSLESIIDKELMVYKNL